MIGLDTNILVRFIAQDDALQSPKADAIMASLTVEEPGWIALAAIAEFAWVMKRKFRISREQIYLTIWNLLSRKELVFEQREQVSQAMNLYRTGSADFSDYLVAVSAQAAGCVHSLTFDRKAAKMAGMILAR